MSEFFRRPWDSQPPPGTPLDKSNPLAATITHFLPLDGNPREIVNGSTLTYGAGGSTVASVEGIALKGSGSAACASVPLNLSPYTTVTLSFWMYWNSFNNGEQVALEFNQVNNGGFLLKPNEGTGRVLALVRGATGVQGSQSFTRPASASWNHYVVVLDRLLAGGIKAVYVNGQAKSLTNESSSIVYGPFSNATLRIFSLLGTSNFGAGQLQNLAIRGGYQMTAAEALQEYAQKWSLYEPQRIFIPAAAGGGGGGPYTLDL